MHILNHALSECELHPYALIHTGCVEKFYNSKSSCDHCTFHHFASLLGRLPAAKDSKKDMTACTDFLMAVSKGHYLSVACSILGIKKCTDVPPNIPNTKIYYLKRRRLLLGT